MFIPALSTQQDAPQKGKETVELQRALVSLARTAGNSIWRMFFVTGSPRSSSMNCFQLEPKIPVVRRERAKELWVFIFPLKWGAIWSYQEFPNHILEQSNCNCCGNSLSTRGMRSGYSLTYFRPFFCQVAF